MSTPFTAYPEITGTFPESEPSGKNWAKKHAKQLKKNNKLIERFIMIEEQRAKDEAKKNDEEKSDKSSFWSKWNKTLQKAVLVVLGIVSTIVTAIFMGKSESRNRKGKCCT